MSARPEITDTAELPVEWKAGSLRITAYCTDPPDPGSLQWWEFVTKQPAEVRNVTRTPFGQLIEQGTIGDRTLHLQVQLNRVDWVIFPKDDTESENFPTLGEFEESSTYFRELISQWLSAAPPLNRLAFGAQMYIPVANQPRAMEIIAKILPFIEINWKG